MKNLSEEAISKVTKESDKDQLYKKFEDILATTTTISQEFKDAAIPLWWLFECRKAFHLLEKGVPHSEQIHLGCFVICSSSFHSYLLL
jgi:hypothetical protein